jgi:hypothetical protein
MKAYAPGRMTAPDWTSALGSTGDDGPAEPLSRRDGSATFAAVVALILAPLVVVLVTLGGAAWHPASDLALELLRIADVGGRHTPLVGAHSRYGWDHPGPLLFWWLAPFRRLLGTTGVLVGVVVLNASAAVGALVLARRRGGGSLVVLVGLALLSLAGALGPSLLADPWNPWAAVLPFFTYVLLAWSLADGDVVVLPWVVVVGTFLIQTHVGYLPLVLGLGLAAGAMAWLVRRRLAVPAGIVVPSTARSALIALVVGTLLWLPPLLQQLFGRRGNLAAIVRSFRHPAEAVVGWRIAWGIMGTELGPPGAWLRGHELEAFGVRTSSALPAVALLGAAGLLGVLAARSGSVSAARLAALTLVASALGLVAGSRVTGFVGTYLVRWWWVIAACVWLSIAWSTWTLLARTRARSTLAALATVAVVALSGVMVWRAALAEVPSAGDSAAIGELASEIAAVLDGQSTYVVDWTDGRDWGAVGSGVFVDLEQRGLSVAAASRHAPTVGAWRTAPPQSGDGLILVFGDDDLARGLAPPPDATVIAEHEPMTTSEQQRAHAIEDRLSTSLAALATDVVWDRSLVDTPFGRQVLEDRGVPADLVQELAALRTRGSAYTAYLQRHPNSSATAP